MGQELERQGVEGEDYFVITKAGREIVVPIRKTPQDPYSDNPQVRAYQLVHEGRIGGQRNGTNSEGKRKKRISAAVVEEAQERLQPKIIRVLERGLNRSSGIKQNLATVKLITDMEHHEASLVLKEEEIDLTKQDRGELIGTLRALLENPSTEAALEDIIEGTAEEVQAPSDPSPASYGLEREVHVRNGGSTAGAAEEGSADRVGPTGASVGEAAPNGSDSGQAAGNGHRAASTDRGPYRNPWKEVANRRADD